MSGPWKGCDCTVPVRDGKSNVCATCRGVISDWTFTPEWRKPDYRLQRAAVQREEPE